MSTNYPNSLDSYPVHADNTNETVAASYINNIQDAVHAIEQTVGVGSTQPTSTPTSNAIVKYDTNKNLNTTYPVSIGQNPNLLFNPTARLGFTGWNLVGTSTGATWSTSFGVGGEGGQFIVSSSSASTGTTYYESQHIPINPSTVINISGEIASNQQTAGTQPSIEVHAFNSTGGDLGAVCSASLSSGQAWGKATASGTAPANTSYVTIRMIYWSGSISPASGFRKIKLEAGSYATTFSDDNTFNTQQYGSVLPFVQQDVNGNASITGNMSLAAATANGHAVNLGQFGSLKSTNGYQKFPDGHIEQWFTYTVPSQTFTANTTYSFVINLPIAFPAAFANVEASVTGGYATNAYVSCAPRRTGSLSQVTVDLTFGATFTNTPSIDIKVIGW